MSGLVIAGDAVDGHEIARAVQREYEQHGARQLGVQRACDERQAFTQPILDNAPCVKSGTRIGEREAEQHRRHAELLKSENGG